MSLSSLPVGLTTAAYLKAQLDQGKDYFDLLVPFAARALAGLTDEVIDPQQIQEQMRKETTLVVPLRTVGVLLDRLVKTKKLRREFGRYLCDAAAKADLDVEYVGKSAVAEQFEAIGEEFRAYAEERGAVLRNAAAAIEELSEFLESNGSLLLLDGRSNGGNKSRRAQVLAASFINQHLKDADAGAAALGALLQGLILRRAVLLSDLATVQRRLDRVVVYLDTPLLFALCGLYGKTECEAMREACRVMRSLGVVIAVLDVTIAEMRRVLSVYESHLDTQLGRSTLDYSPLTRHFFSVGATAAFVRERSVLLQTQLGKEGVVVHDLPARIAEFVDDEQALSNALRDTRGVRYTARENHDVDCVAAVLTLRRGASPVAIEDARALFVSQGRVVGSVLQWWRESNHSGVPPIISTQALVHYCWLKQPAASTSMLRFQMAAMCAEVLRPSRENWLKFTTQLQRMVNDGLIESAEAAALVIDEMVAKCIVDVEDDGVLSEASITEVIDQVREHQRRELAMKVESARDEAARERDRMREEAERERERLQTQLEEVRRDGANALASQSATYDERLRVLDDTMNQERNRADQTSSMLEGIADVVASAVFYGVAGLVTAIVATIAVFPYLEVTNLSPLVKLLLKTLTILITVLGGTFGFAAVPWARDLRGAVKRRLLQRPARKVSTQNGPDILRD